MICGKILSFRSRNINKNMKTLLVILTSEETIYNIQFIKELRLKDSQYLFMTTEELEQLQVSRNIIKTCNLPEENVTLKYIDPFSVRHIRDRLEEVDYDGYEKIWVNVSGGTKVTSLTAMDFFKEWGAEIYYMAGGSEKRIQLFPRKREKEYEIKHPVTLSEYLCGYGFEMKETRKEKGKTRITQSYTSVFFDWYTHIDMKYYDPILTELQKYRNKKLPVRLIPGLETWLKEIDFPFQDPEKNILNKYEVRYLTGNWFEDYVYYRLRNELNPGENLKAGISIKREGAENEFDVMMVHDGLLYTIECKTSLYYESEEREENIIPLTIYKSTALQNNLGLYSRSSIFTLDSELKMTNYYCQRAKAFGIHIFFKEDLMSGDPIAGLLGIM